MLRHRFLLILQLLFIGCILCHRVSNLERKSYNQVKAYWTPERLQNARPIELVSSFEVTDNVDSSANSYGDKSINNGGLPIINEAVDEVLIPPHAKREVNITHISKRYITPQDGAFTSSRVIPSSSTHVYPYITVCKLFFEFGGDDYICSCSVIGKRLVLTAGHCVHSGNNSPSGWHSNFLIVPDYRNGVAPYGSYSATWITTSNAWYSNGNVPNAEDWGIMVAADVSGLKIGDRTGWLGWLTQSLVNNHVTLFGYPYAFDGGEKMHQVNSYYLRSTSPNCAEYPCDMTGGASGGPWVQDFGEASTGAGTGTEGLNYVVGVNSYGSDGRYYMGSSTLNNNFISMYNSACNQASGNC